MLRQLGSEQAFFDSQLEVRIGGNSGLRRPPFAQRPHRLAATRMLANKRCATMRPGTAAGVVI